MHVPVVKSKKRRGFHVQLLFSSITHTQQSNDWAYSNVQRNVNSQALYMRTQAQHQPASRLGTQ